MREARQCVFKSVRSLKGATKRRVRSLKGATKRREGNCDYFSQFIKPYSHTLEVENKSAPMPMIMMMMMMMMMMMFVFTFLGVRVTLGAYGQLANMARKPSLWRIKSTCTEGAEAFFCVHTLSGNYCNSY